MARLIYSAITSLDGYVEDLDGSFDWAMPDEEVHQFINDLERPAGTYLYGRRMYETMLGWETDPGLAAGPPVYRDYAQIWQAAEKIVYSRTLRSVSTQKTRIERDFEPEAVRRLKAANEQDLLIGGPHLAVQAFRAGLVDECQLYLAPVIVSGGKPVLPGNLRVGLTLLEERSFANGMVYLRYRVGQ